MLFLRCPLPGLEFPLLCEDHGLQFWAGVSCLFGFGLSAFCCLWPLSF